MIFKNKHQAALFMLSIMDYDDTMEAASVDYAEDNTEHDYGGFTERLYTILPTEENKVMVTKQAIEFLKDHKDTAIEMLNIIEKNYSDKIVPLEFQNKLKELKQLFNEQILPTDIPDNGVSEEQRGL